MNRSNILYHSLLIVYRHHLVTCHQNLPVRTVPLSTKNSTKKYIHVYVSCCATEDVKKTDYYFCVFFFCYFNRKCVTFWYYGNIGINGFSSNNFLEIITQFWTLLSHVVRKRTNFVLMIQQLYNVPEGKIYFIHLRFSVQCERDALCVRRRVYIVI